MNINYLVKYFKVTRTQEITHLSRCDGAENVDDAVGFFLPLLRIFFPEQSAAARKTRQNLVMRLFKRYSPFWHEIKVSKFGPSDPDVIQ